MLRELKETSFRLRVLRKTGILRRHTIRSINECAELVKIVATLDPQLEVDASSGRWELEVGS